MVQVVDDVLAGRQCLAGLGCHLVQVPAYCCLTGRRHSSANKYTFKHTARPINRAGQLSGCTICGANASISTETPILTASHNMKLTALPAADTLLSRLLRPRAIKAPGTTTAQAPYSADANTETSAVTHHATKATITPTAACAATTHQTGTWGCLLRKA